MFATTLCSRIPSHLTPPLRTTIWCPAPSGNGPELADLLKGTGISATHPVIVCPSWSGYLILTDQLENVDIYVGFMATNNFKMRLVLYESTLCQRIKAHLKVNSAHPPLAGAH